MRVTHEDLDRRVEAVEIALSNGVERFQGVEDRLDSIIASVDRMAETIAPIRDDISTIKEMTGGWKAIGTVGKFIKWVGVLAASFTGIIGFMILAAKAFAATVMKNIL